jgi:hypothetical protein
MGEQWVERILFVVRRQFEIRRAGPINRAKGLPSRPWLSVPNCYHNAGGHWELGGVRKTGRIGGT